MAPKDDEKNGVWQWFNVTSELLETARQTVLRLATTVFVRSGDALHLACAEVHGFKEVYANDRHVLEAARHFHLVGVNTLGDNG
jgi:predicted nucleic acid-binding protein